MVSEKCVSDIIYSAILKSKKGLSSRQIILKADGIGDPTRLVRFMQSEGLITSVPVKKKINGKWKNYKLYKAVK